MHKLGPQGRSEPGQRAKVLRGMALERDLTLGGVRARLDLSRPQAQQQAEGVVR